MQPTFLPWLGYFGLIKNADKFVFLDDFQFVRRSFHQRNRLFINKAEAGYITVPVEHAGRQEMALNHIKPMLDESWKRKFLGTLKHNYSFSSYLPEYYDFIESWVHGEHKNLAAFNIVFIEHIARKLGLDTIFALSSEIACDGQRSEKILSLLHSFEANTYLSAYGSYEYMEEDDVLEHPEFCFLFQNFQPAPYPQHQNSEFVPYLSVLDCILQNGPEETVRIIEQSDNKFYTVEEMRAVSDTNEKVKNA